MKAFSPQAKIILYILLVIAVFASTSDWLNIIILLCTGFLAYRLPASVLKRGLIPIILFLVFTFFSNVLFQEGERLYEIMGLAVTEEGLVRGGRLTLRLLILILGAKILTATTRAEDIVEGMGRLLGPIGRTAFVTELIYTMSLTLRLLPIIYDEAMELFRDVKNSDDTSLAGKLRLSVSLLTPLFERSLRKAREMAGTGEGCEY